MSYRMDSIKKETKLNVQIKAVWMKQYVKLNSRDTDSDRSSSSDGNLHI